MKFVVNFRRALADRCLKPLDELPINGGSFPLVELSEDEIADYTSTIKKYEEWMTRLAKMEKKTKQWIHRSGTWEKTRFVDVEDHVTGPQSPEFY